MAAAGTKLLWKVGVISDTHGLIRPEALERLRGSDLIVHCGDVGAPVVLDALGAVAPVRAVRGNNDKGPWASTLPVDDVIEVGIHTLYVIHDLAQLGLEPAAAGFAAVLSGHSHRPFVEKRKGVLFINPGSAGPRRFSLPVAVAQLVLSPERCDGTIIEIAACALTRACGRPLSAKGSGVNSTPIGEPT